MNSTVETSFLLVKKIKDQTFDVDQLHLYTLCLSIGVRDMQVLVTNQENKALLLEDYQFKGITTVNSRIRLLINLFDNHHILKAGFWKRIKVSVKSHKYTLVPHKLFIKEAAADYVSLSAEIKPGIDKVVYCRHIENEVVCVFLADGKLMQWLKTIYPNKQITYIHQGTALIEGIMKHNDLPHTKALFGLYDYGILHLVCNQQKNLLYYNQFAIQDTEDLVKYTMMVFKEMGLSQKETPFTMWGGLKQQSKHVASLQKYIRNISFGARPSYLKFSYHFDELPDHQFFDVFNIPISE